MGLLFFFRRIATQVHNWARITSGTAKEKVVEVMQLKDQGVPSVSPAWSTNAPINVLSRWGGGGGEAGQRRGIWL